MIGFRSDDALIYARYVRNFRAGLGLVYNPGERWNAVTSPLGVWVLVAASLLGGDIPTTAVVVGGVLTAVTVYLLIFAFFASEWPAWVGAGAGLLFATVNMNYLAFGMESPLLMLLLTALLVAYYKRQWTLLAVLVGLAGATRGEAVFLAGPLYLGLWWKNQKVPWRLAVISLLVIVPFLMFNVAYYGRVLPDTLAAKVIQGRSGLWGGRLLFVRGAAHVLTHIYVGQSVWPVVALMCCLPFLGGRKSQPVWWLAIFLVSLTIFYSALPVPAYGWYLLPFLWVACILAPMGVATVYRLAHERRSRTWFSLLAMAILGFFLMLGAQVRKLIRLPTGPYPSYVRAAEWLRNNVRPQSSLGAAEVGHLGWYTSLHIVDILGITSPGNARLLAQGNLDGWLRRYKPDYILIHTYGYWPVELGAIHALLQNNYGIEESFSAPGLILLGPPKRAIPAGSLLGRPFVYGQRVREGAYIAGGKAMRGLLISSGSDHIFITDAKPKQVFEAYVAIPEGFPPQGNWSESPATSQTELVVVAIQSASQAYSEILRERVVPGAWQNVTVPIPLVKDTSFSLILKTERARFGDRSDQSPVVWGEPRLDSSPSASP